MNEIHHHTVFPLMAQFMAPKRVACLGDSVTAGFWQDSNDLWPARLQYVLGEAYRVTTFARAGTCAQTTADNVFAHAEESANAKAATSEIIILCLGTNDAKDANWTTDEAFTLALSKVAHEHRGAQRTLLCTPPPAHLPPAGAFGIREDVINNRLELLVTTVASQVTGIELVSVHDHFRTFSRGSSDFVDGVHPNQYGQALIARAVAAAVLNDPSVATLPLQSFVESGADLSTNSATP